MRGKQEQLVLDAPAFMWYKVGLHSALNLKHV